MTTNLAANFNINIANLVELASAIGGGMTTDLAANINVNVANLVELAAAITGALPTPGVNFYQTSFGDGSLTSIDIYHNLNSWFPGVWIRNNGNNEFEGGPTVKVKDQNTLSLYYDVPPASGEYAIHVIACDRI